MHPERFRPANANIFLMTDSPEQTFDIRAETARTTHPHVVILGSGFAAMEAARKLKPKHFRITVVSPRNHFLFTPLLTAAATGTVEERHITRPIRELLPRATTYQARCRFLDPDKQEVICTAYTGDPEFRLSYDRLVIAIGGENNTFGVPGVREHAVFLKEVSHAQSIRHRLLGSLERASLPGIPPEERRRLLHWIVVGGGPTGAECVAEMFDFLQDLSPSYSGEVSEVQLTLLEATDEILPGFDQALKDYAARRFHREGVRLLKERPAKDVQADRVVLSSGEELPCGLVVWSTGICPRPALKDLNLPLDEQGFLRTDSHCRVPGHASILALGDTARMENRKLPATAQVAQQQGAYAAALLNRERKGKPDKSFTFHHKGMLTYVGGRKALADTPAGSITGRAAWIFWRSVYLTKLVGWRNKWNVLRDWILTGLFGRETSRIP